MDEDEPIDIDLSQNDTSTTTALSVHAPLIMTHQSGKRNSKDKRGINNNKRQRQYHHNEIYSNIVYQERLSSGRPGSPHRYFDDSYDVYFDTERDGIDGFDANGTSAVNENNNGGYKTASTGNQVVHRHLNGLCIITAGSVLENCTPATTSNNEQTTNSIASVSYFVKVGKDAQSARGKLRAKNKKKKGNSSKNGDTIIEGENREHDGNVSPTDPLCEVTFVDGRTVLLKCCVSGTVIEVNRRLKCSSSLSEDAELSAEKGGDEGGPGDPSLLLSDPLLDGYIAVVLPTGNFPPRTK
ncbi:predicted protein [Thalassiosira pseudonana CCMP1335]|jgi:hypothetical protein|uniref:Protein Abitram n=1 Tax=Thalassiosira pseudonana TaxID=35128 RepID=B8C7N5_THAPS|nr:predicted protein [Thalassiosira pseudonana CCMP1335]EED90348.1 predicted protein [Thalassiosira pseudonana CCMP1335]